MPQAAAIKAPATKVAIKASTAAASGVLIAAIKAPAGDARGNRLHALHQLLGERVLEAVDKRRRARRFTDPHERQPEQRNALDEDD